MNHFYRLLASGVLLLLLLTGCLRQERLTNVFPSLSKKQENSIQEQQPAPDLLHAAVSPGDTLNPYTLSTRMNNQLMPLLYDPLVKLDQNYQPQNYLAETLTLSDTACTVRLRGDAFFSDGSPLTAADVLYSLELCMRNSREHRYGNLLSSSAPDEKTLVFSLARPDAYFASLLSFPIIRQGSGEENCPPGTGRYRLSGQNRLLRNDRHFEGGSPIREIGLIPVEDVKEIGYEVITGRLDYALLDLDAFPVETAGSFPVQTNNLLYLGCNNLLYPMNDPAFRQALGLLIDRGELVNRAYSGRAVSAPAPINPLFLQMEEAEPDIQAANELIDSLGLTARDENGYRMAGSRTLELQLAINVENTNKRAVSKLLQLQLEKGGLRLVINEYSYEQYKLQIGMGAYSLYLGQVLLPEDMDISAFLSEEGALHYQLGNTGELYALYLSARQTPEAYRSFLFQFKNEQPFIPLLFPQSLVARSRNFYSSVLATEQDIFYNIHKW
ncbi:MAG: hypothetical protein HFG27_00725 [Provencibacterium sp.]|jgi:peptide/nickel transport system substrate-binding protein|nr:hypothetical protein [Provencibacterium sp.]